MKQKCYGRADGKLYECVICDSCRTEDAETFDCLRGQVPESLPYWCIIVNKEIKEMNVDESRNKVCL